MAIADLKLKRGQLGTEAHKLLSTAGCSAEQRAQAEKMLNEADELTGQITLLERADKLEAESRTIVPTPRPNPGAGEGEDRSEEETAKKYRRAFEVYVRLGAASLRSDEQAILHRGFRTDGAPAKYMMIDGERRDITTGGTSGAYIVPQQFYNELISGKKFIGALLDNCRRKSTPGNGAPMKIGLENDTANTIVTVTEGTTVTDTDPALSGNVLSTDTLATLIKVSKQELADSGFDLPALFRDRFGKRYKRGLENFIANGNASNIASVVAGITQATTTAAATGPVYEDFVAAQDKLDPIYEPGAKWFMHKSSRTYVMSLLDTLNRPLFLPNPQTGMLDQILGFPIALTSQLPAATTAAAKGIVFGDMTEGYLLRDDGEMTIQRLDERFADQLMVGFLAYTRAGGEVTDAGTHPLVGLWTHA